jgi:mannose-6-phosphate isomerase
MRVEQPLTFRPLYMERVWGGRRLAEKFGRALPAGAPIGESWELVDREDAQSVVENGPLAGKTLHELWTTLREPVFGRVADSPRFPLLAKILDARETLSVQVHPPANLAAKLKGEPNTEMWFLLDSEPGAELFAGFRRGTTRAEFELALKEGRAADLLHRLPVRAGDAIFIPSGRCHAIGAGCFIVEMQQNSDTTYRVFDWNRVGLDSKPRPLHLRESLLSIDFTDHEPTLAQREGESVVKCAYFKVGHWALDHARADTSAGCAIFTVLSGGLTCGGCNFRSGDFFLLPASTTNRTLTPVQSSTSVLRTTL